MKNFPVLYSLNSNGSTQQWAIKVDGNKIIKNYGQVGGKTQTTEDVVSKGKNVGRSNETTPQEQAELEAQSQWEKKLKSGYNQEILEAQGGKVDSDFVVGGVEPMLAHKFKDQGHKIIFPCYVQPKLDGIRCIAIVDKGKCTLWTRTRKPITSVPHINTELETIFKGSIILDGELYNHDYKNRFEDIVSFVRQETPAEGCEVVQYHVYDTVKTVDYDIRMNSLELGSEYIKKVETHLVKDSEELMEWFDKFKKLSYEGAMARNVLGKYENKRSYNLQKIKEFDTDEFTIKDVKSGRGRMTDCAIFVCVNEDGKEFDCKMEGSLDRLKAYLEHPEEVIGEMLTIRFQALTAYGIPRFPIGVTIRKEGY